MIFLFRRATASIRKKSCARSATMLAPLQDFATPASSPAPTQSPPAHELAESAAAKIVAPAAALRGGGRRRHHRPRYRLLPEIRPARSEIVSARYFASCARPRHAALRRLHGESRRAPQDERKRSRTGARQCPCYDRLRGRARG